MPDVRMNNAGSDGKRGGLRRIFAYSIVTGLIAAALLLSPALFVDAHEMGPVCGGSSGPHVLACGAESIEPLYGLALEGLDHLWARVNNASPTTAWPLMLLLVSAPLLLAGDPSTWQRRRVRSRRPSMENTAHFSPCRRYRYKLWRHWGGLFPGGRGYAMFVGLNPSTADETTDDPTVRRCIDYAKAWGYDGLCMTNLFAFRATHPTDMILEPDPVGPDNDAALRDCAAEAAVIVAAWGVHGTHLGRDQAVRSLLPALHYLALTQDGHPWHPLYLRKGLAPQRWD